MKTNIEVLIESQGHNVIITMNKRFKNLKELRDCLKALHKDGFVYKVHEVGHIRHNKLL